LVLLSTKLIGSKMKKSIVTDTEFLSQKCEPWDINDPKMQKAIDNLLDTAQDLYQECAGLAFNQIGILKRGFAIKIKGTDHFRTIINPRFIMKSPTIKSRFESCLSRPNQVPIKKRRSVKVKIEFYDVEHSSVRQEIFRAFEARIVQHETDHLNGVLI